MKLNTVLGVVGTMMGALLAHIAINLEMVKGGGLRPMIIALHICVIAVTMKLTKELLSPEMNVKNDGKMHIEQPSDGSSRTDILP